jgi:hypothetical protein
MGSIYLIQDSGQLVEMAEQAYDSEDLLQELLAKYPNLLAGDQIDSAEPRRWLLVTREAALPSEEGGVDRWSVDHLFLDQDAIPTLVEVKRSSDTRIRREVVGQMLDYAANAVVYWPVEEIRAKFEAHCGGHDLDSEQMLTEFLGDGTDPEHFWQSAKTNLQAGRIRLIFVADEIPTELRRIVEFLNEQMDPTQVLAVEIKQYADRGLKTLVPRVIGQTVETERKSSTRPVEKQWDVASFFQELNTRQGDDAVKVAERILEWANPRMTRIWWGQGSRSGSFVPVLRHKERDHQLFSVWTYGTVEIYFYWYLYKPPFDSEEKRRELQSRLNAIPGVSIPDDAIAKRPGIRLSVLKESDALQQFLETFDWVVQEIKAL